MTKEEEFLVNGSGLFASNSCLNNETKLRIFNWFSNLSKEDVDNINILRYEVECDIEYTQNRNDFYNEDVF